MQVQGERDSTCQRTSLRNEPPIAMAGSSMAQTLKSVGVIQATYPIYSKKKNARLTL